MRNRDEGQPRLLLAPHAVVLAPACRQRKHLVARPLGGAAAAHGGSATPASARGAIFGFPRPRGIIFRDSRFV